MRELNYYWFFLNWQIIEAKLGENKNRLKAKGGGGGGGGGGGTITYSEASSSNRHGRLEGTQSAVVVNVSWNLETMGEKIYTLKKIYFYLIWFNLLGGEHRQ